MPKKAPTPVFAFTFGTWTPTTPPVQWQVKPATFKRKKTRHGVDTICQILDLEGKVVATLHDTASAIVAKVEFTDDEARKQLQHAAETWFKTEASEETRALYGDEASSMLSEYLRSMTMRADQAYVEQA